MEVAILRTSKARMPIHCSYIAASPKIIALRWIFCIRVRKYIVLYLVKYSPHWKVFQVKAVGLKKLIFCTMYTVISRPACLRKPGEVAKFEVLTMVTASAFRVEAKPSTQETDRRFQLATLLTLTIQPSTWRQQDPPTYLPTSSRIDRIDPRR